jgi:hypothetical protein
MIKRRCNQTILLLFYFVFSFSSKTYKLQASSSIQATRSRVLYSSIRGRAVSSPIAQDCSKHAAVLLLFRLDCLRIHHQAAIFFWFFERRHIHA